MKTPPYYVAPLKSRAAICAWLLKRAEANPRRNYGLFCYNVKLNRLDDSFEHALKLSRESGDLPCDSTRYLDECRDLWESKKEVAFEFGAQDAASNVLDCDSYRMLWDGNGAIANWEFAGRSGGWLVLTEFDGGEPV